MAAASLFSLVFIVIGAGMGYYAMKIAAKARQSTSWPSTEGEIAHSAVLYNSDATVSNNQSSFKADISYRYKVKGLNYSSSRISMLDYSSTWKRAQSLVHQYPDKSQVRVYYNPTNYSDAVLEPGEVGGINVLLAVGAIFAASGIFFLIMSLSGRVHTG